MIKHDNPETRQYKSFCAAIDRLIPIFESTDNEKCVLYFLRQNGLVTLGSKFSEFPVEMQIATFKLMQTMIDSVCAHDESLAKDMDMALGITALLQSIMRCPITGQALEKVVARFLLSLTSLMVTTPKLLVHWFEFIETFGGAPALVKKEELDADTDADFDFDVEADADNKNEPKIDDTKQHKQDTKIHYNREFPLFYILVEYIHHDGFVGESARTGLLYLIEVASKSQELAQWVIDSDLGSFMASGLGALYSQVCRLVVVKTGWPTTQTPETVEPVSVLSESSSDTDLDTFLSYLLFWQDMLNVLEMQDETDILKNLTNHLIYNFDALFVRQLLYPSVVESSDNSGGYSSVLLEILATVLNLLDHNRLSQLIVCYFLGETIDNHIVSEKLKKRMKYSRRHSSLSVIREKELLGPAFTPNLEISATAAITISSTMAAPARPITTFEDIIKQCLESQDSEKRASALRLLSVLIAKYYPYIVSHLFEISSTVPTIVNGKETRSYKSVKIDGMEELHTIESVLKPMMDKAAGVIESDDSNDQDEEIYLGSELLGRYYKDSFTNAVLQMRTIPSPQSQLLRHLPTRDLQRLEKHITILRLMRLSVMKVHRIKITSKNSKLAKYPSHKNNTNNNNNTSNTGTDSGNSSMKTNHHKDNSVFIKDTKKAIIDILFDNLLVNFFENGLKENLALTQVLARLGLCGWIDFQGSMLDGIVIVLKQLKQEYVARIKILERQKNQDKKEEMEGKAEKEETEIKKAEVENETDDVTVVEPEATESEKKPEKRRFSWVYSTSKMFAKLQDSVHTQPSSTQQSDPSATINSNDEHLKTKNEKADKETANGIEEVAELVASADIEKLNLVVFYEFLHEMYSIFVVRAELYDQENSAF